MMPGLFEFATISNADKRIMGSTYNFMGHPLL